MQFIDLAAQQAGIRKEIEERLKAVLDHGRYIMGPEIRELEEKLSAYVGVKHAIGCSSGTDALLMALMALGVGPGDAVFTSPFTFVATAEVVVLLGATPVFVDIDPITFNIDPVKLESAVRAVLANDPGLYPLPRKLDRSGKENHGQLTPRGIIPVDLFGLPADYDAINRVAEQHGLFVIQDAAQSFGAEYRGRKACSHGTIGGTSFFPAKPLGCYGDGGMCFTDDDDLAERMVSVRIHGKGSDKYDNVRIGLNGRLDTFQAAVLLSKFSIFPEEIGLRQEVAGRYDQLISGVTDRLVTPRVPEDCLSVWAQYSVLAENGPARKNILESLRRAEIPSAIYYPKPLHLQAAFSFLGYGEGDFPVSEDCAARIFSLPMHPYLGPEDQRRVVEGLGL
ncbi:MAG: DegT/DnrJ/EryC1/StrS family aminotransferase [Deltaproteobacteria bacterium]|nr:DegT/DnrJ/EryC1/StrS family aminotransferase [Deltaproteobacteria bacterium]